MLPDVAVLRPGVVADLAGAGNGVEGPGERPGLRIVRLHAAADAVLGAGEAGDDEPVVIERRARDGEPFLPSLRLHRPDHRAGPLIEREELAVQLADEHLAVAQADAAARPPAADGGDLVVELRLIAPQRLTRLDADRKHIVCARDDVDDAVVDDRLGLAGILDAHARAIEPRPPDGLELRHVVAIDLRQRRVAAVVQVAAVGQPARGRKDRQVVAGEGRCRRDGLCGRRCLAGLRQSNDAYCAGYRQRGLRTKHGFLPLRATLYPSGTTGTGSRRSPP